MFVKNFEVQNLDKLTGEREVKTQKHWTTVKWSVSWIELGKGINEQRNSFKI